MDVKRDEVKLERGLAAVTTDADNKGDGVRIYLERGFEGTHAWVTPAQAREVAALLVKHADRAEGK